MSFKNALALTNIPAFQLHIERHKQILQIILSASPTKLHPHIKDCVLNNHSLMVYVGSAVWASQLRFYSKSIKDAVNTSNKGKIRQIRIRVLPPSPYKKESKPNTNIPSQDNIALIKSSDAALEESKLKTALLHLSSTLQKQRANKAFS